MLIGITRSGNNILFVRLLGPKHKLEMEAEPFRALCLSIQPT